MDALKLFEGLPQKSIFHHPAWANIIIETYGKDWQAKMLYRYKNDAGLETYPRLYSSVILRPIPIKGYEEYFDAISPVWGGVLWDMEFAPAITTWTSWIYKMLAHNKVVTYFIRYDPLISNHRADPDAIIVGDVVYIDLTKTEDRIKAEMKKETRNAIDNARRKGIKIVNGKGPKYLERFKNIYNSAMKAKNASPGYIYPEQFYKSLDHWFGKIDGYRVFIATRKGKDIAASLEICGYGRVYDMCRVYLNDKPVDNAHNLLLWKVICWAKQNKLSILNLGGRDASGSFSFKEGWSSDRKPYFIGKKVLIPSVYNELLHKTGMQDKMEGYFPLYRLGAHQVG